MTERRTSTSDHLSVAQTARTSARTEWIDRLIDDLIEVFPEREDALNRIRDDLQRGSAAYADTLNAADRALIDRVSAIVGNETLDREAAIDALRAELLQERES